MVLWNIFEISTKKAFFVLANHNNRENFLNLLKFFLKNNIKKNCFKNNNEIKNLPEHCRGIFPKIRLQSKIK